MVLGRIHFPVSLLVVSLLASACGGDQFDAYEAVSNAPVVQTSEFPMVAFVALPGGRGLCTGTFIASRAVLTAAHCTQEAGTYRIFASFGTFSTTNVVNLSTGQVADPNDIALLILPTDTASWEQGQIAYIGEPARERERVTLVGYGCDSLKTRLGTGTKRKGENFISEIGDYIELETPQTVAGAHGILGPINRAGSCFGDSGGPMFRMRAGIPEIVGASHSGGYRGSMIISHYIDLHRTQNIGFLESIANQEGLNMQAACSIAGHCSQGAMAGVWDFFVLIWFKFSALFR